MQTVVRNPLKVSSPGLPPLPDSDVLAIATAIGVRLDESQIKRIVDKHKDTVPDLGCSGFNLKNIEKEIAPGCRLSHEAISKLESLALQENIVGEASRIFLQNATEINSKLDFMKAAGYSQPAFVQGFQKVAAEYRLSALALGLAISTLKK